MSDAGFMRAIDRICVQDPRYAPAAYLFLRQGLDVTVAMAGKHDAPPGERHVSGRELCEGLRLHALAEFGPLARTVLAQWGVSCTADFGNLVFNLVDAHLLGKSEEDSPDDFQQVYAFDEAFTTPFLAQTPWHPDEAAQRPSPEQMAVSVVVPQASATRGSVDE